jgi:hypothetical protein
MSSRFKLGSFIDIYTQEEVKLRELHTNNALILELYEALPLHFKKTPMSNLLPYIEAEYHVLYHMTHYLNSINLVFIEIKSDEVHKLCNKYIIKKMKEVYIDQDKPVK